MGGRVSGRVSGGVICREALPVRGVSTEGLIRRRRVSARVIRGARVRASL
jgi:hypothetical protein